MKKKILLVEDNPFLSDLYKDVLSEAGFNVDLAITGNEALEKSQKGGWDLILMDVFLPDRNGFDIVRQLKETPPQIPNKSIVFFTNLDKDEEVEKSKTLGDGFIMKGELTPGDLVKAITPYLEK